MIKKIKLVTLVLFSIIFLIRVQIIYADCAGPLQCYGKNAAGVCQTTYNYNACAGNPDQYSCIAAQDCECGVMSGGNCTWTAPCDCSWGNYGNCSANSTNTACIKYKTCTCDPVGCGSCTGSNWTTCTASELGCTVQSCPTYEGYTGGSVRDGTLNGDCTCGMKTCPPICTATDPDAPVLSNPASGTIVNVNTSVNLDWNAISSWGTGCPQSNKYQVCVMSDSTCDLLNWVDVASTTTIKAWTPTTGDSTVTWKVRSNNGSNTAESLTRTLRVNAPPTFTSLVIKNANNVVAVGETGGTTFRNHICQTTFQNTTIPRRVIFEASVSDADGASDIGSTGAVLKWNGKLYTMTKVGSPVGVGATMRATVDFGVGDNSSGTYDLFVTVTDIYGGTSGEVNTNRDFKVWDCQVPVSGTLFQAPDGVQVCSTNSVGIGFSIPIEDKVGFESITFSDTPNVVLTDDDLDSYGSPNNVIWGKTYLPLINGGDASNIDGTLLATGRQTRIIDIGVGTTTCSAASQFTIDDARVSPYSATPRAQVDFSFIQDQESWYQVSFAGIRAKSSLTYGVPYTAPDSSRFLTLGNSTTDNGLVSAISFTNINGNNNNEFGSPKNWWINKNISGIQNYSYDYFYNNLFLKKGIGSTGTTWNQRPSSGIFFVSGNLSINSNQVSSTPPLVIVRGGIDITTDVTQLDGIYIADGNISIGGTSASALNVNGSLYAGGNIRMYRSFTNKTINNTTPAVKVNYNPGLIMRLPVDMVKVLSNWRSE